jgi:L,D-transpeptidase catalytic domain
LGDDVTERSGRRLRRRAVVGLLLAVSVAAGLVLTLPLLLGETRIDAASNATASHVEEDASAVLPQAAAPAFVPGKARFLSPSEHVSRWAIVRKPVIARVRPDAHAGAVAEVSTRTPEGTSNIVLVLGNRIDNRGVLWIRVQVSGDRNIGWVPRQALGGYGTVATHLVIDRESFTATLYRRGRPIFRARVGVGLPAWPTPRGDFYIRNKLTGYASPEYGPIAFGTSARSRVLTDWPAGGFVGIHGTDQPGLIPGRISHGCIRMRNEDIVRLSTLMPVGTPLTID